MLQGFLQHAGVGLAAVAGVFRRIRCIINPVNPAAGTGYLVAQYGVDGVERGDAQLAAPYRRLVGADGQPIARLRQPRQRVRHAGQYLEIVEAQDAGFHVAVEHTVAVE